MDISSRVAERYLMRPKAHRKTAAFPPGEEDGGGSTRNIPKGHEFQAKALKPLSKALWASTVALGHTLTAYRHLSRVKSATVSPDGNLGGRGYVMKLADMRQKLYQASEALSSISDTIYDEIQAPHWKPKLAQLDESDQEDVSRFVEEAENVMDNPEGEAEEGEAEIEKATSKIKTAAVSQRPPNMSERAWVHEFYCHPEKYANHPYHGDPEGFRQLFVSKPERQFERREANSSLPVSVLPGGPRVDHIGPGEGQGEYGDFSEADTLVPPPDQWSADGGGKSRRDEGGEDYDYTSEWENMTARSQVPDHNTDDTPTDAWDFGIGYGARGDGAGDYGNPSGEGNGTKGVHGPRSGLPGSPSQSSGDTTRVILDDKLNPRQADYASLLYGKGQLPQDVAGPPSRRDEFPGPKDNMVSVGTLLGTSEMPTIPQTVEVGGQPLLNTYTTHEDANTDYQRYDHTTRTLREPSGEHPGQEHQEPFAPGGEATR